MYLAVKLYKDVLPKWVGMPDYWPAEVKELGNSRQLPSSEWLLMTYVDYLRYKAERQSIYDQFIAAQFVESVYINPDESEE